MNSAVPSHSCLNLFYMCFYLPVAYTLGGHTVADRDDFLTIYKLIGAPRFEGPRNGTADKKRMRNVMNRNGNSVVIRHCIYKTITALLISAFYVHTIVSWSFIHRASRVFRVIASISLPWARENTEESNRSKFSFSSRLLFSFVFFFFSFLHRLRSLFCISLLNNNSWLLYIFGCITLLRIVGLW